uniref:Uncharacterized protein n=1 Tax=Meloidogyne javanica TaxID=6303 RepID=A0A915LJK2_MELJA
MGQTTRKKADCAIAGDKGGDNWANVTKFGFFISTTRANSYRNFTIISIWPGADSRVEQEKHLPPVLEQIKQIDSLVVSVNGAGKTVKIQWMLIADLKCLKDIFGHKGPASNFPCTLCRAPKEELNKIGVMRTFGEDEKNYSYTMKPLLPAYHFKVIPPTMHILHGLVNRSLNILWDLTGAKEMGLGIIDKKPDPHTHQFIGDDYSEGALVASLCDFCEGTTMAWFAK